MDRIQIKDRAKAAFSQDYWRLVGIILLGGLLVGGISVFTTKVDVGDQGFRVSTFWSVVTIAYSVFVGNVISVGLAKICLAAYRGESYELNDLFYFFKGENYLKVVGAMALYTVFVLLGCICLVVPGIIVAIGLSRVPFLLADGCPEGGMDLIKKSWEIMKGHRNEYFVFVLSFIGWFILTVVTAGIVGVFYANPYTSIACAGYHDELMAAVVPE